MSCVECMEILSPQEARIAEGQLYDPAAAVSPGRQRIFRQLQSLRSQRTPRVSMERAVLFTESFRKTEGEHIELRWAKAMLHIAQNISLYIGPDDLIVGRADGKPGRHGIIFPELEGSFLDRVADLLEKDRSLYDISKEELQAMREIAPFWKGRTMLDKLFEGIPPDVRKFVFLDDDYYDQKYIITQTASTRSSLQWVPDYNKVIYKGFGAMRREIQERLDAIDPGDGMAAMTQVPFLQAMLLTCDAQITFARRYAEHAASLAKAERDPARKAELKRIAEVCAHVPEHPARNFHEAVQAHWIYQAFTRLEQRTGSIVSNGRLDQLFYPFYAQEKAAGTLTDDDALELLECMWLNMAQYVYVSVSPQAASFYEGYAHWEAVTVGGKTPDGRDATNELTYLLLRSKREVPLNYPDLAVRIHSLSSERYLTEIAETIKEGSGFPKVFNDDEIIPLYLEKGVPVQAANDYALSGCTECRAPNWDTYISPCPWLNLGSVLEMTFNDGRVHHYGNERLGLATGDARNFKSYEEVLDAFKKQLLHILKHTYMLMIAVEEIRSRNLATPLFSLLHDKCMEQCLDLHTNQVKGGASIGFFDLIGLGTVIDSLAAVKKLVFDEGKLTMRQIVDAVEANFEGHEDIRRMVQNCPKYGNNDPYVDSIGYEIEKCAVEYAHAHRTGNNTELDVRYVPVTSHIPLGKVVWASPNGRLAGTYLSEGASASHGADINGPTSVLLSNAHSKFTGYKERASRLLNIKLSPNTVGGREGSRKLVALLRTFCALRLWHIQFNVVNRTTLLKAQNKPEEYRNLLVRVAGYSAYFVDLSNGLQSEIIDRMEHASL